MKYLQKFDSITLAKESNDLVTPLVVKVNDNTDNKIMMANFGNNVPCKIIGDDLDELKIVEIVDCLLISCIEEETELGVDPDGYYQYEGECTIEGNHYYKWRRISNMGYPASASRIGLTTNRTFENASIENPVYFDGWMISDAVETEYTYDDIVGFEQRAKVKTTLDHHDTSKLNTNGVSYVDLGLPSGALWATMNIGANINSVNGYYGKYFQWGDTEGYMADEPHDFSWSTYKYGDPWNEDPTKRLTKYNTNEEYGTVDNKTELELSDDVARANLGGDWHMPNVDLLAELYKETENHWEYNYNGIENLNGRLFTSKQPGNINTLFIPASGDRDGSLIDSGDSFYLWSSILFSTDPNCAYYLYADAGSISIYYYGERYNGFAVRGVLY